MSFNIGLHYYTYEHKKSLLCRKVDSSDLGTICDGFTQNELINKQHVLDAYCKRKHLKYEPIEMKVSYPGVLIGSGYMHQNLIDVDKEESDFQLGFFFDHTTGIPLIPGSSVKGVLRAVFPQKESEVTKLEYVNDKLGFNMNFKACKALENAIFGTQTKPAKDTFLEAFITKCWSKAILVDDYITPHTKGAKRSILTNPRPLRFLKIASETHICFQFLLEETKIEVDKEELVLTSQKKIDFFKAILADWGIGAKRNVGYGTLT